MVFFDGRPLVKPIPHITKEWDILHFKDHPQDIYNIVRYEISNVVYLVSKAFTMLDIMLYSTVFPKVYIWVLIMFLEKAEKIFTP